MPHNIDSMMYYGETPWHGLGTRLEKPATAEIAIRAAGLEWEAIKVPMYAKHSRGETLVPDAFAMMRGDRMQGADAVILGTVGSQYEPIQNRDAFAFFDPIVGEGAAIYHTAGSLGLGERIWILAKLPGEIEIAGQDITEKYLLLANSHDGSGAVQIKFTPIRVVCQNTLNMALKGESFIRIAHTRGANVRMADVHKDIEFIKKTYDGIETAFKRMAKVLVDDARLTEYVEAVFPIKEEWKPDRKRKIEQQRQEAVKLFEAGTGNAAKGVRGTLWAAYNGITEYADHRLVLGARTQSGRVDRLWFGDAAKLKEVAYDKAFEFANSWTKA